MIDKQFVSKEEYLWGEVRLPLEFILEDLQKQLRSIAQPQPVDLTAILGRLDALETESGEKADTKYLEDNLTDLTERISKIEEGVCGQDNLDLDKRVVSLETSISQLTVLNSKAQDILDAHDELAEAVDCVKTIRVVVSAEDIKVAVESGGSSFWGNLLGGIAGGALGGLGSALGSVISTKGQIASMLGSNALQSINGTLAKVGAGTLSDMGKNVSNMGKRFDAYTAWQRTSEAGQQLIQRKINAIQQNVHGKFDTLDNIVQTVDTISKWTDPETGETVKMTDKVKSMLSKQSSMSNDISDLKVAKRRQELIIKDIADMQKEIFVLKNTVRLMRQAAQAKGIMEDVLRGMTGPPVVLPSPPVTRSKIDTFEWINSARIKNILRKNGTVDSILDNITEININLSSLDDSIKKIQNMKRGLMASYTTGSQPFNPHSNVRFQNERKETTF